MKLMTSSILVDQNCFFPIFLTVKITARISHFILHLSSLEEIPLLSD